MRLLVRWPGLRSDRDYATVCGLAAIPPLVHVTALERRDATVGVLVGAVVWAYLGQFVATGCHELGHALAARLCRFRIVAIRLTPTRSYVWWSPGRPVWAHLSWRWVIVHAAGILSDGLVAAALLWAWMQPLSFWTALSVVPMALWLVQCLANLIPTTSSHGKGRSDGAKILDVIGQLWRRRSRKSQ